MSAVLIPAGWGYAPGCSFAAPRPMPATPQRRVRTFPIEPAKRAPRPWWRLSSSEVAAVDSVHASGWSAAARGALVREHLGLNWNPACRVARVARAEAAGQLPDEAVEHLAALRERNKAKARNGQEGGSK